MHFFNDPAAVEAMRVRLMYLRSNLPESMAQIESTLSRLDPLAVFAVGFARYALKDPESFEEPDHPSIAPLEHVAVLYTKNQPAGAVESLEYDAITKVFDALDEIMVMWLSLHPEFDGPKEVNSVTSVRARIMMQETMVRMLAFPHQIEETASALFEPFTDWMNINLGFTVDDLFKIIHGIERRNERVFNASLKCVHKQLNGVPPQNPADFERLLAIAIAPVLSLGSDEIASESGVSLETVEHFIEFFSLRSSDVPSTYIIPSPALPLKTKPVMRLSDKYIVPSAMLLDTAVQPAMEHAMNPASGSAHSEATEAVWQAYVHNRKEYSEKRSLELMARVLPGAQTYRDLKYRLDGREYDLDGLVLFERYLLLVEVKAGNFSVQARFGDADALVGDIQKLIDHPHEQGERALRFLSSTKKPRFRFADKSVVPIEPSAYDRTILITVTLEDLGQLTSAYNQLPKPARGVTPWAVSLHDLEVIADHVGTAAEFLQYVVRRIALTDSPTAITFDELEWFGKYLTDSLDGLDTPRPANSADAPVIIGHTVDLNSYYLYKTGVRHAAVKKPHHKLPEVLRSVLDEMQRARPTGWLAFASVLLELTGDEQATLNRKAQAAIGRGRPTAFVCRSTNQLLEVWVKVGAETVLAVEPRSSARQFVLELKMDGSLATAYWVGSGDCLTFAETASPANVAIPLPQVDPCPESEHP